MLLWPGKSMSIPLEFEAALRFVPVEGGESREVLPPGQYQVVVSLNFKDYEGSKEPYWVGKITSEPLEIEVGAQARCWQGECRLA